MLSIDDELELLYLYQAEEQEKLNAWYNGDLYHKLHSAQKLIYDTIRYLPKTVRDCILYCARRFGKSYLMVVMALEDCIKNPGEVVRIIGPELEQTIEIVEFNMGKIIHDAPPGFVKKLNRKVWRVGNAKLVVGGFDNRNVRKNLGKEAVAIYTEEAGASKSEDFHYAMREIVSPQLFHTKGRIIHGTTPPRDLDHCFELDFVPRAAAAGTLFRFTLYDNPLADEEMINQAIEDSGGIDTDEFKRNFLCMAVKDRRILCTPSFDQAIHVCEMEIPTHSTWLILGDWGGVRDRTWLGVAFWDFNRAKMCVVAEIDYDPNTESGRVASDVRAILEPHIPETNTPKKIMKHHYDEGMDHWPRWVDCAGQTRVDLLKDHELLVQIPHKDDFDAAINQLELAFLNNKIEIHPRCKKLIATAEYGRFNKQRTDFYRSEVKGGLGHCDALAGLMYGWRMVDKTTNPFPKPMFDRETYYVPEVEESEQSLREYGEKLKRF